ncbi:hypothetical protein Baya_15848 [Bagarius yarrelli]|uniref:Uncharacterized protein n=1 Tax=Bagarius yarrelli TaxID=175774 RepID=A0A556VV45_BAGYA|nr:hypothetical protein Baya_15848 [Bagarius yarrelli]
MIWAKRAIGKRLKQHTIEEAHILLGNKWQIPAPIPILEGKRERKWRHKNVPPAPSKPPSTITVQASVHAEAERCTLYRSVLTVCDKNIKNCFHHDRSLNDWSPFRVDDSDSHSDLFLEPPENSPKAQHPPRPSSNPCVRQEEELLIIEEQEEGAQDYEGFAKSDPEPKKISSLRTANRPLYCGAQCAVSDTGDSTKWPKRHINTSRKSDWKLTVCKKLLFMGFNLSRIPPFKTRLQRERTQGHVKTMEAVIIKLHLQGRGASCAGAGINSRAQNIKNASKQMQATLRGVKKITAR